jgi:CheY-like chemotaxis protein
VADDEPLMGLLIENILGPGYRVLKARDGREAIDTAIRERPNLVVLDLRLPRLDGAAVCEFLKADRTLAATPVMLMTGSRLQLDFQRGRAAAPNAFLTKPFSPGEFLEKVEELLSGQKAPAEATPTS